MRLRNLVAVLVSAFVVAALPAAAADSAEFLARDATGAIVRVSATGAVVGQVAASGGGHQWSPDGTHVAFTRRNGDGLARKLRLPELRLVAGLSPDRADPARGRP